MKKTFMRAITLALVAVMLLCTLTACGKRVPAGAYEAKLEVFGQSWNVTYTFKGSKVTATNKITLLGNVNTVTAEGKYEIIENADGTMEISLDFSEESESFKDGTYTYEEGEGYIKIGEFKYTKVQK